MKAKNKFACRPGFLLLCVSLLSVFLGYIAGRSSSHGDESIIANHNSLSNAANCVIAPDKTFSESAPSTSPAAIERADWKEDAWRKLLAQSATPARNAALADLLEKLAAHDPDGAMTLAKAESNLKLREQLTQSVLHGWARTSPLDAAKWVMAMPNSGRRDASLLSVFAGAITTSPDSAIAAGRLLIEQNPGEAVGCGSRLIEALSDSGNFGAAADFAADGDAGQRNAWLTEAFSKWSSYQPANAVASAQAITDPAVRNQALRGSIGGWSEADPAAAVRFLSEMPAGGDRDEMFGQALKSWARNDPIAAANWLNSNNSSGLDLDQGAAQVAGLESLPQQTALAWAESIKNPELRSITLAGVLRDWIYDNPTAAQDYVQTTTNLAPGDRQQLSEVIDERTRVSSVQ
jgi:hypothetical protein